MIPESGGAPTTPKPGVDGVVPDIVVLLTDGASNWGIEPLDAVPYAVARRVRIYPIASGRPTPHRRGVRASSSGARSSILADSVAGTEAVGSGAVAEASAASSSQTSRP